MTAPTLFPGWRQIAARLQPPRLVIRLAYLPPLLIYAAAGVASLTGLVSMFFIKDYLDLSAAFLAGLGFWTMLPWALKMPVGHLVDVLWRVKSGLVYLGAALIATSLLIMVGLLTWPDAMRTILSVNAWFVLSALLAPIGYVLQDAIADALTVEAVPHVDAAGQPLPADQVRQAHTTMQLLGRVAILGGGLLVAGINVILFQGAAELPPGEQVARYRLIYLLALGIPLLSVSGVVLAGILNRRDARRQIAGSVDPLASPVVIPMPAAPTPVNAGILGGSAAFVTLTLGLGLAEVAYSQELIFLGSLAIIAGMMRQLLGALTPDAARTLLGTALVVFAFRATPGLGAGASWWAIERLGFDQAFLAQLDLLQGALTLVGLLLLRRWVAERSMTHILTVLVLCSTVLSLPNIGLFYGLHHWAAAHTGGVVDARFIALVNTALESPLGQVAMVPMLAWIAQSAPAHLKATFFAVLASFTNLALSAAQLGTKYLNQAFMIERGQYDALGGLMISAALIGLIAPLGVIGLVRGLGLKTA